MHVYRRGIVVDEVVGIRREAGSLKGQAEEEEQKLVMPKLARMTSKGAKGMRVGPHSTAISSNQKGQFRSKLEADGVELRLKKASRRTAD
jgi:hypothetical protein